MLGTMDDLLPTSVAGLPLHLLVIHAGVVLPLGATVQVVLVGHSGTDSVWGYLDSSPG